MKNYAKLVPHRSWNHIVVFDDSNRDEMIRILSKMQKEKKIDQRLVVYRCLASTPRYVQCVWHQPEGYYRDGILVGYRCGTCNSREINEHN